MADASVVPVPRQDPTVTNQNIESLEQDRDGGGVRLVQTVAQPAITGAPGTILKDTVTTTEAEIVAANEKRVELTILNFSAETIFYNLDATAATVNDMPLMAYAAKT